MKKIILESLPLLVLKVDEVGKITWTWRDNFIDKSYAKVSVLFHCSWLCMTLLYIFKYSFALCYFTNFVMIHYDIYG